MADECLKWTEEAPNDDARHACLLLARIWLKEAMRESIVPDGLPPAPTLAEPIPLLGALSRAMRPTGWQRSLSTPPQDHRMPANGLPGDTNNGRCRDRPQPTDEKAERTKHNKSIRVADLGVVEGERETTDVMKPRLSHSRIACSFVLITN